MSPRKQAKLFALVTAVMVGAALVAPGTAQALPCRSVGSGGGSVLVLKSFHVTAEPSKKVVGRGDKLKVHIKVTRPAHEDPLDNGIQYDPPTSVPEKDVMVGISIWVGERTYFYNMGITDANGEETLTLTVPRNSELGDAYATASAYKWLKQDCPDILETGFTEYEHFLTVVP